MTDFIKLTQITNWKIEKEKKEPTTTKSVYVRPQDIVSFGDDDGTTLVQFADKGIHVKESAEEIYEMIHILEYHPLTWREPISFRDNEKQGWWWETDWWNHPTITCDTISKNTPYYGYAIVFGNGEVWE
jgi:hypothetical protein